MKIERIAVTRIKPDPNQPRTEIDEEKVKGMAQNLKNSDVGIINPIEIDKNYMIVTGEQRWRAATLAGMKTVPCKIIETKDRFFRQVVENIHQGVMSDWDVGCALKKILYNVRPGDARKTWNDKGYRQLARTIGIGEKFVREKLAIFKECKTIQKAVKENKITARAIKDSKRAPQEYQEKIKEKFIKKEIATVGAVGEIASAVSRRPDRAKEILDKDYSKMTTGDVIESVRKVSPGKSDIVQPAMEKVMNDGKQICEAITELQRCLKEWPYHLCSEYNQTFIAMALKGCTASIKRYVEETKQLK